MLNSTDSSPLITVAMPVFNAGDDLRLAVLSIIQQTYKNWELLLVDDGSTDNSVTAISDLISGDVRITVLCDGLNKGLAVRLNECIDLAHGQYLARMDQDDISYPERFEKQVAEFNKNMGLDLIAVSSHTINGDNLITGLFPSPLIHRDICSKPWNGFYFPHPTWLGKIEWFRQYHYRIPGPYFCEDQDLLLRSYRNSNFSSVSEILFAYRIRDDVNLKKLFKTRWAVLNFQIREFYKSNSFFFMGLSCSVFFVKLCKDLMIKISFNQPSNNPNEVTHASQLKWNKVLFDLTSGKISQ